MTFVSIALLLAGFAITAWLLRRIASVQAALAAVEAREMAARELAAETRRSLEAELARAREDAREERARLEEKVLTLTREGERLSREQQTSATELERVGKSAEAERETLAARLERDVEERMTRKLRDLEVRLGEREGSLFAREKQMADRERQLGDREGTLDRRERDLAARVDAIRSDESRAVTLVNERKAKLEAVAGLSGEDARRLVIEEIHEGARREAAREAKRIEDVAREEAEKKAKRVIGLAIQRYAGDHVQERAATAVHLPSDELKGRIIGREGRNIRALQEACGVDFIVDDTPETIVVSAFDPVRREVARVALERLVQDGRIHPSRIEEVVDKARHDVERGMDEAARAVLDELQVSRVHPEIAKLLGRLRHRYSYAQNVLRHSVECAHLTAMMAGELGLNEKQARRAGLLHDIGKAVSHEQEGGHAVIGGALARKFGEDATVANAIACHHDDEPAISVIGHLVTAADALSGARPGARREALESYVNRLHDLEAIAARFMGVERSFAIQAGREVRVLVEPGEVTDAEAALLAREISRSIEEELTYPGQVRVTVVRETRAVDYAK
jgi:ribonuclease Y